MSTSGRTVNIGSNCWTRGRHSTRCLPSIILLSLTARDTIAAVPVTATASRSGVAIGQSIDELRMTLAKSATDIPRDRDPTNIPEQLLTHCLAAMTVYITERRGAAYSPF